MRMIKTMRKKQSTARRKKSNAPTKKTKAGRYTPRGY